MKTKNETPHVVQLSSRIFLLMCAALSALIIGIGPAAPFSSGALGAEVFATILLLFISGSFRYRLDKNALTYGAAMVIAASFAATWWPRSVLKASFQRDGFLALAHFLRHRILGFHELDALIHLDAMLFILGLTFFVSVVAQSRMLESFSFAVLEKNKGEIFPTVALLTAIVAFASGILDGVSMIGLTIRTLVIILTFAKAEESAIIFAIVISTVITTVCGMWLAYGEPPNLIMKANLHPYLTNTFFLGYCLPVAIGTYALVLWNLRRRLRGKRVELETLDVMDLHTADVRFLQASRHGEVFTPMEFIEENRDSMGRHFDAVSQRLRRGESLGDAYVHENVPKGTRLKLFGLYAAPELADALDQHYAERAAGTVAKITAGLDEIRMKRNRAQRIVALSFIPFVGFLIWHSAHPAFPLFWASFSAFAVAFLGLASNPKMRKLTLREASLEYREYLFLFPLFLSITLLQKSGFFDQMPGLIHRGIERLGTAAVAFIQFSGACFLSALLDNNVVADFASRALHGLETGTLHLFSMAQIAGYAAGGCWTHIGSGQSVVAYAFIRREIDEHYTPVQWIKLMTPTVVEIFALMLLLIYALTMIKNVI